MNKTSKALLLTGLSGAVAACSTTAQDMQPAVLINPGSEVTAELSKIVSAALNGRNVRLAGDVLTKSERLIMDPVQAMGPYGNPMDGRMMGRPDHFTLKMSGGKCFLLHEQQDVVYEVKSAQCASLIAPSP